MGGGPINWNLSAPSICFFYMWIFIYSLHVNACMSIILHLPLCYWWIVSYLLSHGDPYSNFQALAKEIVMSRKAVNRLYENKAQLNSISMHLGESVGMTTYASEICALRLFQRTLLCSYTWKLFISNIGLECCWHVLISMNISIFELLDL